MATIVTFLLLAATMAPAGGGQSLVRKLLRIAGLTAAPSQLRGPAGEGMPGAIWIADLDKGTTTSVTRDGGYRSPVFAPANAGIYALKDDTVVRVAGARETVVAKVPGAVKLVGFDAESPGELLVLFEGRPDGAPLAVVSVKSGGVSPLPHDAMSREEREMLAQIRSEARVYGNLRVYTLTESKRGLSRAVEWTDVYIARADGAPRNVSKCDGVNCVQPALSPDGRRIAFIRTEP